MRTLPNLDLLRSLAVLSVVLEHILLAYGITRIGPCRINWIGVVGVFLFFVHTSLVLMWSLERKPHTLDFYIRRIFRIYPLAMLACAAALLFHAPVNGNPLQFFIYIKPTDARSILGAFLLIPNIVGGYIPLSVMWSLPYEVEMYVLLPVLFFFIHRNFSLWPLLLLWAFALAICRELFHGVSHNFFLCIPYFLPGVMAYVGFSRHRARLPAWAFPLALFAAWALFLSDPGWRVADFLCLAVGLGLPLFHQIKAKWLIAASHNIAKYSYGMYLAHPFSIVLGVYLLPHRPLAVQLAVILGSLAVFAVGGYHLLESPMIRLGSRLANRAEQGYEQQHLDAYRIPEADIR
jgi:peptidoglycan/LPS O-acetylase OafA/YrhL